MKTVGAFTAKTHFSELLRQVAEGNEIAITKHGKIVAHIIPAKPSQKISLEESFANLDKLKKKIGKRALTLKEIKIMKEQGRS